MSHSLKQICKLPVKVPATQILCVLAKAGLLVWGRVTAEIMRAVDAAAPEQCSGCDNTAVPLCGRIDFTAPGCRFCAACWEKYDANVKSNAPNHRPLPTVALLQSALLRKHETPEQIVGVMKRQIEQAFEKVADLQEKLREKDTVIESLLDIQDEQCELRERDALLCNKRRRIEDRWQRGH